MSAAHSATGARMPNLPSWSDTIRSEMATIWSTVLTLPEAGPVAVYSAGGKPQSFDTEFTNLGNGIYQATLPAGVVNITR